MLRVAMVMKISCVGNGWDAVMWERADTHKMPGLYKYIKQINSNN